jgi:hypothetical protein
MSSFYMAGLFLIVVFGLIAGIHFYWAAGGSWGSRQALPQRPVLSEAGQAIGRDLATRRERDRSTPLFTPGRMATVAVALLFFAGAFGCAALLLFPNIRAWQWGSLNPENGALAGAIIFALRAIGEFRYVGFSKRIRGTEFAWWDDRFFSPLCVTLAICLYIFSKGLGS